MTATRRPATKETSAEGVSAKETTATETAFSERDRLVLKHLPLVRAIAVRVYESLPVHVDLDDLVHAGVLGLFDAVSKFAEDKQATFQGYAKHRIRGAILDSLREMDWASRDLRKRHKQLEAITHELAAVMERNPTEAEIAEKMGMDVPRWRQVALELRMVGLLSASSRPEGESDTTPEFPAAPDLNPDVLTAQQELRNILSAALKGLPERYQAVIGLYYMGGKTMREIGERLGINESRVSQIHKAALDQLQENLAASGIHSPGCLV